MTPSSSTPMASIKSILLGEEDMVITHDVPTKVVPVIRRAKKTRG